MSPKRKESRKGIISEKNLSSEEKGVKGLVTDINKEI